MLTGFGVTLNEEIAPIEKPVSEIDILTAKVAELEAKISLLVRHQTKTGYLNRCVKC